MAENFSDRLWKGMGDAVADIREKLVDEAMYGRVINERDSAPQWPEAREAESAAQSVEQNHDREQAPDMDIDR